MSEEKTKRIRINDGTREWTLEFNRKSVAKLEQSGFKPGEAADEPATMIPMLFNGAFQMHHPGTRFDVTDPLLMKMGDKTALYGKLVEMYVEPIASLMDEPAEGKVSWQAE